VTVKRILHATDFSRFSTPAFKMATELARALKAELILFHALQPLESGPGPAYIPAAKLEADRAAELSAAQRKLDAMSRAARKARLRVSTILGHHAAPEAIAEAARARRVGLVVVGTRGRTGLSRIVLGSTADELVRTSPCPVLVVRPRRA
jgi:universal stress protein A